MMRFGYHWKHIGTIITANPVVQILRKTNGKKLSNMFQADTMTPNITLTKIA
jgi:hypothetical protein